MDGVVLGSWFAEDIGGAEVGYWVTFLTRGGKGGFYEAFDMQIVGIVNCPPNPPNVNRTLIMMDIDAAGTYLGGMENSVTSIDILLPEKPISNKQKLHYKQNSPPKGSAYLPGRILLEIT